MVYFAGHPSVLSSAVLFASTAILYSYFCMSETPGRLIDKSSGSTTEASLSSSSSSSKTTNRTATKARRTLEDEMIESNPGQMQITIKPIGVVRSIYRLCVGTPRQGLLAPHSRGRIELSLMENTSHDAVNDLEEFSHIWILFIFHLNTLGKKPPTKIAPPALGGRRLGVFATRSPHRFNPIGITLAKLDAVRVQEQIEEKKKITVLDISGVDLVDGTPVVDIKPFVPAYDGVAQGDAPCVLPPWVEGGLATRRKVTFLESAQDELREILSFNPNALEFYKPSLDGSIELCFNGVMACIEEILSIDVRSQYQTSKVRRAKFQAERAQRITQVSQESPSTEDEAMCTQQLDNLLVHYTVKEARVLQRSSSAGSGSEDEVLVQKIVLLES